MCTNQRKIYSKYCRFPLYVKCGHCPACQQEKAANRVKRINNTKSDDMVCLMVSLTYSRGTAPYVLRSEAYDFVNGGSDYLKIYRDCSIRKVRKPSSDDDYNQVNKRVNKTVVLDTIEFDGLSSLKNTKDMKHEFGKIGVVYYPDYQHFMASLRLNLKRHFNYESKFFVYACSEFGIKSDRPHFHLLLFIPKYAEAFFRAAVLQSWRFSDLRRFPRAIERSYRGASYVASYVNQRSNFPKFFKDYFRPKHSYSKGFGLSNPNFSLDSILRKFERGDFSMPVARREQNEVHINHVPLPSYVLNRYFPKIKGFTRYPAGEVSTYIERIIRKDDPDVVFYENTSQATLDYSYKPFYDYGGVVLTPDELKRFSVRLNNSMQRFYDECPDWFCSFKGDFNFYSLMYQRVWTLYNATVLRLHLQNDEILDVEKYDNWDYVLENDIPFYGIYTGKLVEIDPNKYESTKRITYQFEESFRDHIKHKSVNNAVYLAANDDCEL